jgi:hypothetical protein
MELALRGVFAGNIFDLGAEASAALHAEGRGAFAETRQRLHPRPWVRSTRRASTVQLCPLCPLPRSHGHEEEEGSCSCARHGSAAPGNRLRRALACCWLSTPCTVCAQAVDDMDALLSAVREAEAATHGRETSTAGDGAGEAAAGSGSCATQQQRPLLWRKAAVFVDNAGCDAVLGMLPFARVLLQMGMEVSCAAAARWRPLPTPTLPLPRSHGHQEEEGI